MRFKEINWISLDIQQINVLKQNIPQSITSK